MSNSLAITCANKNLNGVIVRIGGDGWTLSTHEAIVQLMSGELNLHILLTDTYYEIGIRGTGTDTFLVLEPDGRPLHQIDGLLSC